jgi:NADH:ubiquinone oxidoreductase subunit E
MDTPHKYSQSSRRVIPIKVEAPSNLSATERDAVLQACTRLKALPGALLPILHAVQEALTFVPKDAVPLIARSSICPWPTCTEW